MRFNSDDLGLGVDSYAAVLNTATKKSYENNHSTTETTLSNFITLIL